MADYKAKPKKAVHKPTKKQAEKVTQKMLDKETKSALPGSGNSMQQFGEAASAARLAQIVNLHIAGYSLADIGRQIGMTANEVDALIQRDAARYVRSQPQLRVYVRNYVSERYSKLLESVWDKATDPTSPDQFLAQDRAYKALDGMRKLHGADAPTQSEVTIEAAPEAVEKMVATLASQRGLGYDIGVFDVVDAEVVEDAVTQSEAALEQAHNAVEEE